MNYTFTRIWRVNHRLIVAGTIEEAIEAAIKYSLENLF